MSPVNNVKLSEERLLVNFPKDFIEFVNNYDVDNFSLGIYLSAMVVIIWRK